MLVESNMCDVLRDLSGYGVCVSDDGSMNVGRIIRMQGEV